MDAQRSSLQWMAGRTGDADPFGSFELQLFWVTIAAVVILAVVFVLFFVALPILIVPAGYIYAKYVARMPGLESNFLKHVGALFEESARNDPKVCRNSLILVVIGAAFFAGAWWLVSDSIAFRASSATVQGLVVGQRETDGEHNKLYAPVVEWTDAEGRSQRFSGRTASISPAYSKGEAVSVRFSPTDPRSARIDDFEEDWMWAIVLAASGLLSAGPGVGLLYGFWRKRANPPTA